ncbi:hypothetical protein ACWKSP_26350 [Micromonosporaceae bacterium Da 78-11]
MTIRRIDPDEAVVINGLPITAWQLAEARQELSHRGVHDPRWAELSQHDQETAALSAGGWLRALAELVSAPDPNHACAEYGDAHLGQPCPDSAPNSQADPMAGNWCAFCLIPGPMDQAAQHRADCPALDESDTGSKASSGGDGRG